MSPNLAGAVLSPLLGEPETRPAELSSADPSGRDRRNAGDAQGPAGKAAPVSMWDKIAECQSGNLLCGQVPLVMELAEGATSVPIEPWPGASERPAGGAWRRHVRRSGPGDRST